MVPQDLVEQLCRRCTRHVPASPLSSGFIFHPEVVGDSVRMLRLLRRKQSDGPLRTPPIPNPTHNNAVVTAVNGASHAGGSCVGSGRAPLSPHTLETLNGHLTLLALVPVLLLGCGEVKTATYATYEEAVADEAFARGWLPSWLPEDAVSIRETHDIDTNRVWAEATLSAASAGAVLESCPRSDTASSPENAPSWWAVPSTASFRECSAGVHATIVEAPSGPSLRWFRVD
jgi:hypothetical protein